MPIPIYVNDPDKFISDLTDWYKVSGQNKYDEVVTISDHMLQAATIAHDEGASKTDVLSCLFHDIGHMIIDEDESYIKEHPEIINELEIADRGIYCGSLFYQDEKGFSSNIAIRTIQYNHSSGEMVCWGGGGITVDSNASEEWNEIQTKVGALMQALEK